ncbi:MAG: UbiA family prenyltransferase [Balneolaceae bacterium]
MIRFIIHLRLHYQLFILSGGYLLGGVWVSDLDLTNFWLQFLNVHILLYGGATAFNSWWDKDEGPIGGLKNPPEMEPWMRELSLLIQFAGLIWAFSAGRGFAVVYGVSMVFFWLYSTPLARWKGSPVLSLAAIGVSTGTNSVLLGAFAGGGTLTFELLMAAAGSGLILLSLYPVSQIYQIEEDRKRGDETFAARFGIQGVQRFFALAFITGIGLIAFSLFEEMRYISISFAGVGTVAWLLLLFWVYHLKAEKEEYDEVMKIKFVASLLFVMFLLLVLSARHLSHGIEWTDTLF